MPRNAAIVGIGGFANNHHVALRELENQGRVRLIATCDPRIAGLGDLVTALDFGGRGVSIEENFKTLLEKHAGRLGLVAIPAPIHLHAPMHAACVARGLPCYLEKPPSLNPAELAEMVRIDDPSRPTAVGFQYLASPAVRSLKRRIVKGEFGRLLSVELLGLWPRGQDYYQRNQWAGRLSLNGNLVLDSCAGNAMSHHVMNILFYAGTGGEASLARPLSVTAQLYRANPIQGADTVFAEFELEGGVRGRIALSHAIDTTAETVETLVFETTRIEIRPGRGISIMPASGVETILEFPGAGTLQSFSHYLDFLEGKEPRPAATLSDCTGFVDLNALLYLATNGIGTMPSVRSARPEGGPLVHVPELADVCRRFAREGEWPQSQSEDWAIRGGRAGFPEISGLRDRVTALAGAR